MIQRGVVDVAAIDCVTHALLEKHRPGELVGSRVLHCTEHVPAPPYVTTANTTPQMLYQMREAIVRALDHPSIHSAKETLLLTGVEVLSDESYRPIESLESVALGHNYREIPGQLLPIGM